MSTMSCWLTILVKWSKAGAEVPAFDFTRGLMLRTLMKHMISEVAIEVLYQKLQGLFNPGPEPDSFTQELVDDLRLYGMLWCEEEDLAKVFALAEKEGLKIDYSGDIYYTDEDGEWGSTVYQLELVNKN